MLASVLLEAVPGVMLAPLPGPSVEPLTLAEVKLNLRVDGIKQDDLIADLIVAAREYVEAETDLVLIPRVVTETARELGRWIELASWPVTKVVQVRAPGTGGMLTALSPAAWQASYARRPVRLIPTVLGWGLPSTYGLPGRLALPVEIDVDAGYATPADVPMRAKQAMHMLVAHWFANRSAVESGARAAAVTIPIGVDALLDKLRLRRI